MTAPNGCTFTSLLGLFALLVASLAGVTLNPRNPPPSIVSLPEPCTIQAARADVPVRVGPGLNRAIRRYLPAGQSFTVIGKATAGDRSLWWKGDMVGVEQAWVAQSDVATVGGNRAGDPGKRGAYLMVVKDNQPGLLADVRTLFNRPPGPGQDLRTVRQVSKGHGRLEIRTLSPVLTSTAMSSGQASTKGCVLNARPITWPQANRRARSTMLYSACPPTISTY